MQDGPVPRGWPCTRVTSPRRISHAVGISRNRAYRKHIPDTRHSAGPAQKYRRHGSIMESCPPLAQQWDPDVNMDEKTEVAVRPEDVSLMSTYRAWWRQRCPACGEYIRWQCRVDNRIKSIRSGSYVLKRSSRVCPCSSLATKVPAADARVGLGRKLDCPPCLLLCERQKGMVEVPDVRCTVADQDL